MHGEILKKTAVITIVIIIFIGFLILIINPRKPTQIFITTKIPEEKRIGIFGAVNTPGYYNYEGEIRIADAAELAGGLSENADVVFANLAKWVDDGETIIIPTRGIEKPTITPMPAEAEKINLNTATKEELIKLPGIGEKRASDIIQLREEKGGFRSPADILVISGISEKLLENIYDRIIID